MLLSLDVLELSVHFILLITNNYSNIKIGLLRSNRTNWKGDCVYFVSLLVVGILFHERGGSQRKFYVTGIKNIPAQ
jgi:hypothetical protein